MICSSIGFCDNFHYSRYIKPYKASKRNLSKNSPDVDNGFTVLGNIREILDSEIGVRLYFNR